MLKKTSRPRGDCGLICDHIDHIAKVAGIDHVGIGSDYDGVGRLPRGLEDVSCYPIITQELLDRGYTRDQIHKVLGGNVLRVLRQAEKVATQLKAKRDSVKSEALFDITIEPSSSDRENLIVRHLMPLPNYQGKVVTLSDPQGNKYIGQISEPSIGMEPKAGDRMLTFILPELKADTELKLVATESGLTAYRQFEWHDDHYGTAELQYAGRPVMK